MLRVYCLNMHVAHAGNPTKDQNSLSVPTSTQHLHSVQDLDKETSQAGSDNSTQFTYQTPGHQKHSGHAGARSSSQYGNSSAAQSNPRPMYLYKSILQGACIFRNDFVAPSIDWLPSSLKNTGACPFRRTRLMLQAASML